MGTDAARVLRGGLEEVRFLHVIAVSLFLTMAAQSAFAQEPANTCEPVVARVVSIQGTVEIRRRVGNADWLPITRLDTLVCAGDLLRTGAVARAALFVQAETLVRVDQNTTISLTQTPTETIVEFFQNEVTLCSGDARSCGAGYFISRFPKKLKVATPYLNAAVEGTEFQVALQRDSGELSVLEGAVRAETIPAGEERVLTSGESLSAGPSGPTVIKTLISPMNAVQWVLYYPPLSASPSSANIPTSQQCRALPSPSDQACLTQRSEALLGRGLSADALQSIEEALALNPANADANALRAIIQIARNDVAAAREFATAATAAAPDNYRAWLALSYVQQAEFDLEQALEAAKKAQALQPNDALANARVSELLLSLGRMNEAEAAAREAVRVDPSEPLGHTMLGFVHLAQINTRDARADFTAAIESGSFEPLPRLGLGLAIIRDGKLVEGREQIEIAVALDPSNSLLRSYVGKAYYEENSKARDGLAATQFGLAKQLDPNDPTPWFYEAILRLAQNQTVSALENLDSSVQKNDNRAVYRSRLLLDLDRAARMANVAAIYGNLGFEKLAILESTKAIDENPANSSAHELLATAYATLPRYDIARTSEALQAQISQPVTLSTIPPLLGTDNLTILRDTGPSRSGLNEYNALFDRDGFRLQVDGISGSRDTLGDQLVASVLQGGVSASVSQLHYETDGFSRNDTSEKDVYDFFIQDQIDWNSSIQLDARRSDFKIGETFFRFDPAFQLPVTIQEVAKSARLSGREEADVDSDFIWTAAYQDRDRRLHLFPGSTLISEVDSDAYVGEVQQTRDWESFRAIWGVGYVDDEGDFRFDHITVRSDTANAYVYSQWRVNEVLAIHAGVAAERYRQRNSSGSGSLSRNDLSPKLGIRWSLRPGSVVRVAAFSSVRRPFISSQTIEPTQVVGFNQFFSGFEQLYGDVEGTVSKRAAIAFDQTISETTFVGVEAAKRELDVPSLGLGRDFKWRESTGTAYLYQTFSFSRWRGAASGDVEYEKIERPQILTGAEGIVDLTTVRVPVSLAIFDASGLTARVTTAYIDQSGTFSLDVGFPKVDQDDNAWITDVVLDYRLPRRLGVISLGVKNVTNNVIDLVEIDPLNPRVAIKRFAFAKLRLTL